MTARDAKDILEGREGEESREVITSRKEQVLSQGGGKKLRKRVPGTAVVPEGTNREVKALREGEGVQKLLPDLPIDTTLGYKQMKARLGLQRVRPWKWTPFLNPAREDRAIFYHWARVGEEGKMYPFAKYNDKVTAPVFSDEEYESHLKYSDWTLEETRHLCELCEQFDLRFIVIKDRYDSTRFPSRSVEDLKDRYYTLCNRITKLRAVPGEDLSDQLVAYDVDHEKLRKEQLELLYSRTQQDIEEHDYLVEELKKIEYRRKERERISQTAQKLIEQVEITDEKISDKNKRISSSKKKSKKEKERDKERTSATKHLNKITEERGAGPYLRSYRLKVPNTMTNKRAKAMEHILDELGVGIKPIATEKVTTQFNVLRNNVLLLLELRNALQAAEFEMTSLKLKYDTLPESVKLSDIDSDNLEETGLAQRSPGNQPSSRSSTPTNRKRKGTSSSQELPKKNKLNLTATTSI